MQALDIAASRRAVRSNYALLARQPLFLAFVLGCGVSMLGSGRLTLRLIADGTLSFLFVPLSELLGFVISYSMVRKVRPEHRPLPGGDNAGARSCAQAVDDFFSTNQPWLWWSIALIVAAAIIPASRLGSLLGPILMTAPIPIMLSGVLEWRFARRVLGRTRGRAAVGLVMQRAVAWSAATAYFFGVALTSRDFLYTFVEMGQEISNWVGTML
jgi:hypothetical protein